MDGRFGSHVDAERPWQAALCQFFTRDKVAEICLRQVAFPDNLLSMRLLEPAAGQGAFLFPLLAQLVEACRNQKDSYDRLLPIIRAFEVDAQVAVELRNRCGAALEELGVARSKAREIARTWVIN